MGRSALGLYLAALLGGILAGDALPSLCGPALLSAPAMLVAALWQRRRASFSIGWLTLGCLAAGAALPARWTAPLPPSDLTRVLCEGRADCDEPVRVTLAGTLDAHPRPGNGNTRLYLSVEDVIRDARRAPVRGRVRVRVGGETPGLRAGARVLLQARLRAPRRYRNPGCADLPRALARQGIHRAAAVASARDVVPLASRSARRAGFAAARERLSGFFRRRTPEEAPVLAALLLGEGGRIGPSLRDAYARAGVAHVLAVSGLHVAIVAMTVAALLRGVLGVSTRLLAGGAAWRIALLGGTAAAWGYALLAGGREPGLRAAGMAATLVAAALVRRRGDVWYALLLAAAGLTLGDPARVFQPGVQLSFLSVAGLLGFWRLPRRGENGSGRVGRLARWAVRWALASMRASVGATLATLPVQASLFGQVSLVGPLGNLVALPLLGGLAVPTLLAAAAALPGSEEVAGWLVRLAALAVRAAGGWVAWLASFRGAAAQVPPPTPLQAAAWLALVFALPRAFARRESRPALPLRARAVAVAVAALLVLLAEAIGGAWRPAPPSALRVTFLDVGQGDATLLETPEGEHILVDAGPAFTWPGGGGFDAGARAVAPTLRANRIRRIDLLVISHPDADHAGGAPAILDRFEVGEIWIPAPASGADGLRPIFEAAELRRVPVKGLARGAPPRVRDQTRIEVLAPPAGRRGSGSRHPRQGWNDASLVLRVVTPGLAVLLPGDIEGPAEASLLRAGVDLRADVLKIPHHGSATSTTGGFLAAVRPCLGVLSAGAWNRFGFPDPDTLARLGGQGVRILRTDRGGAITVSLEAGRIAAGPNTVTRQGPNFSLSLRGQSAVKERESMGCPRAGRRGGGTDVGNFPHHEDGPP
jgi:competence protein ComEC